MPKFNPDVNRSEDSSSPSGALLDLSFALSEKVLMGLLSLTFTFLTGMACGQAFLPQSSVQNQVELPAQDSQACEEMLSESDLQGDSVQ